MCIGLSVQQYDAEGDHPGPECVAALVLYNLDCDRCGDELEVRCLALGAQALA